MWSILYFAIFSFERDLCFTFFPWYETLHCDSKLHCLLWAVTAVPFRHQRKNSENQFTAFSRYCLRYLTIGTEVLKCWHYFICLYFLNRIIGTMKECWALRVVCPTQVIHRQCSVLQPSIAKAKNLLLLKHSFTLQLLSASYLMSYCFLLLQLMKSGFLTLVKLK